VLAEETPRHAVGDVQALTLHRSGAEDDLTNVGISFSQDSGTYTRITAQGKAGFFLIRPTQAERSRGNPPWLARTSWWSGGDSNLRPPRCGIRARLTVAALRMAMVFLRSYASTGADAIDRTP
jgi:hypothetical protein